MRQIVLWRMAFASFLTALLAFGVSAIAQHGSHPDPVKIDIGSYPADIQSGYKAFANKCSECHGLDSSLKQSRTTEGWTEEVHRMQAMASSHIYDREAGAIVKFLAYDESHRKAAARTAVGTGPDNSAEATGKQLFESYDCSSCHSVAGQGNTAAALDGIGGKRTAAELRKLIVSPPPGSTMPAMDVPDRDLNSMVAYLLTLK